MAVLFVIGLFVDEPVDEPATEPEPEPVEQPAPAEPEPEPEPEELTLDVSVTVSPTQVQVVNQSDRTWFGCTVTLNPGLFRGGWSQGPLAIAAGDTVRGGLMAFTTSDGERFNPATHAVQSVSVTCRSPEGAWRGSFR